MGTIQHAIDVAQLQLQKSITEKHLFSELGLCFVCFYGDTLDGVANDGYDDHYAEIVAEYFAELFDAHFGTDFAS